MSISSQSPIWCLLGWCPVLFLPCITYSTVSLSDTVFLIVHSIVTDEPSGFSVTLAGFRILDGYTVEKKTSMRQVVKSLRNGVNQFNLFLIEINFDAHHSFFPASMIMAYFGRTENLLSKHLCKSRAQFQNNSSKWLNILNFIERFKTMMR